MQPQYIPTAHNFKDMTGQRFGRLVVLAPTERDSKRQIHWLCICDCGNQITLTGGYLRRGQTKSCGCLARDITSERSRSHNLSKHPVYNAYRSMVSRCTNPHTPAYRNYGGRGIRVHLEWLESIESYVAYVTSLPDYGKPDYSVDRIDNDGNYEPGNLRWTTAKVQRSNTRRTTIVTYQGKTQSVAEWAEELGLSYSALSQRLKNGWLLETAFTTPLLNNSNRNLFR